MTLVSVRDLSVMSPAGTTIVDDISFTIDSGEILGVVGESGSGKSTIGLALLGYARRGARITSGRVEIDGTDVLSLDDTALRQARGALVAHIPQDPATALNPALSIGRQLRETLADHHVRDEDRDQACTELMRAVGLPDQPAFLKRFPHQLSGGQQQRICIAMAFACHPRVIVLDEPTTGLDVTTQARVLALVADLCRENDVAALYISHDLAAVSSLADRVMVLYAGRVAELGPQSAVLRQPAHPYTRALLGSTPDIHRRLELTAIPGRAPAPHERRGGCRFEPRCVQRLDICTTTTPPETHVSPEHSATCHRALEVAQLGAILSVASAAIPAVRAEAPLLVVERLNAYYGPTQVLHDIDLEVERGWCVALVGESGSGKTTLGRCLAGLHAERTGTIRFAGTELPVAAGERTPEARRRLQYVFQNPYGALNPRRTIGDSVRLPARLFKAEGRNVDDRVNAALERVGLPRSIAHAYPDRLSGGERQRVAIARALVCEPQVLICDEITSALDVSVQAAIIELLGSLKDDGLATIFVTHDLAVVRSIADHIAVLNNGRIVEAGAVDSLLDRPEHEYTRELVGSSPRFAH